MLLSDLATEGRSMSLMHPLVTTIIPAYNAGKYLAETIDSVLSQTYQNIEILVIDDGSVDDTKNIAYSFGKNVKYLYQSNAGVSAAKNAGILNSKGEYITCLDADDVIHKEKISQQMEFLKANPNVPIVFTDYRNFTCRNEWERSHFQSCPRLVGYLKTSGTGGVMSAAQATGILVEENFTIGSSPLYRRDALNVVGLYDPCLSQGEDFEFHYRFAKRFPAGVIDQVFLMRRLHDANASSKIYQMSLEAGLSRKKILLYEDDVYLKKKIKKWLLQLYLDIGCNLGERDRYGSFLVTLHSFRYGIKLEQLKNLFILFVIRKREKL